LRENPSPVCGTPAELATEEKEIEEGLKVDPT